MKICIASGKGGTGKTLIATNLAYSLGGNVDLLDCDVEEPNAHLFLKPDILEEKAVSTHVPNVDENKCNYCGNCSRICRFSAIKVLKEAILTFPQLCHDCGGCYLVCAENAISKMRREIGKVEIGHRNGITFFNGKLNIGEAKSPPLIKAVRNHGTRSQVTIIDAPPGTSCPVISAMQDTDFVALVTEPTPFGLHDLTLAVEAVKTLNIPSGIIINRFDIGDDSVDKFAEKEGLPVLMKIPFQREIAELYSKGGLLAEQFPVWNDAFRGLFRKIEQTVF